MYFFLKTHKIVEKCFGKLTHNTSALTMNVVSVEFKGKTLNELAKIQHSLLLSPKFLGSHHCTA